MMSTLGPSESHEPPSIDSGTADSMKYPKQGRAAVALLKRRKKQAHRRSEAFGAYRQL
jgi:hypothetical protein